MMARIMSMRLALSSLSSFQLPVLLQHAGARDTFELTTYNATSDFAYGDTR